MDAASLANAGLLGLLAGVGGYVFACAMHVWWRRNRSVTPRGSGLARHLARGFSGVLVVGVGLVAVAAGRREFVPRQGHLASEGLLAVRLPDDRTVAAVTQARRVAAGDVLARFCCPEKESQIRVLQLREKSLAAEKSVLADQPLKLDPELVRRYQDLITDRRQMRASLDQLSPARDLVVRERLRQRLDKRQRLKELEAAVARAEKELVQASAKLTYDRDALERMQRASQRGVATADELQERQTRVRVAEAEAKKVRARLDALKAERKELRDGLGEYETIAVAQSHDLSADIEAAQDRMRWADERARDLNVQLERDAARARRLRAKKIEQLEVEIAQAKAEWSGLEKSLVAKAPFSGEIVYRAPSPRAVSRKAPLVILAGKEALRLRVRLSGVEADALAKERHVTIALEQPGVQRRFVGQFLRSEPLPAESGYVAAELACSPPERAIRDVVEEDRILASLAWTPSLTIYPLFWAGLALAGAGALGRLVIGRRARRAKAQEGRTLAAESATGGDGPGDAEWSQAPEAAAVGAGPPAAQRPDCRSPRPLGTMDLSTRLPYVLGEQLRRMLADDQRDDSLLRALEWVLEHSSPEDIIQIRQGLNGDPGVHERIRKIEQAARQGTDIEDRRLVRALRIVAEDVLPEHPKTMTAGAV